MTQFSGNPVGTYENRFRLLGWLLERHDYCAIHLTVTDQGITATGPGVLSVSPIDTARVVATSPLGNLAPPGHVLPTDHVYFSYVEPWTGNVLNNDCSRRPIYAAGPGSSTSAWSPRRAATQRWTSR